MATRRQATTGDNGTIVIEDTFYPNPPTLMGDKDTETFPYYNNLTFVVSTRI